MKIYFKIILLCFILVSCGNKKHSAECAFYYWKQSFELSDTAKIYLDDLNVKKIYVKYFDVAWNTAKSEPKPVAVIDFSKGELPNNTAIIPTVFITNQTLSNSSDAQVTTLASNLANRIRLVNETNKITNIPQIQIDCDWTLSTKEKFFKLLKLLKQEFPTLELSATIRLHQVKFFEKTGIPPVDRGMLMFYNMGDLSNPETENSILDLKTAEQYLVNFDKYDLPLDVALPLFRWGVLKRRNRMVKLMNNLDFEDLKSDKYEAISPTEFRVLESHYLNTLYLYKEDVIRIESVSISDLEKIPSLLRHRIKNKDVTISFYHLEDKVLRHYDRDRLSEIVDRF
jgi:hypothetical protein